MTIGLALSGGIMALLFALPLSVVRVGVDLENAPPAGDGAGEGELVCATVALGAVHKTKSAHTRPQRCLLVIAYLFVGRFTLELISNAA
jgi:hypothetical protein